MLLRLALLRLALLHKATTTTVLALFPFLRLTFSLLSVFGRMRTMAKLLLVRRYLHIVRSQCTSCKRGRCMSRCCEIRLRTLRSVLLLIGNNTLTIRTFLFSP